LYPILRDQGRANIQPKSRTRATNRMSCEGVHQSRGRSRAGFTSGWQIRNDGKHASKISAAVGRTFPGAGVEGSVGVSVSSQQGALAGLHASAGSAPPLRSTLCSFFSRDSGPVALIILFKTGQGNLVMEWVDSDSNCIGHVSSEPFDFNQRRAPLVIREPLLQRKCARQYILERLTIHVGVVAHSRGG
jgi:hypothetical protein